jgi:hypothetical protein
MRTKSADTQIYYRCLVDGKLFATADFPEHLGHDFIVANNISLWELIKIWIKKL